MFGSMVERKENVNVGKIEIMLKLCFLLSLVKNFYSIRLLSSYIIWLLVIFGFGRRS